MEPSDAAILEAVGKGDESLAASLILRHHATRAPDDRLIPNPARAALEKERQQVVARTAELADETPSFGGRLRVLRRSEESNGGARA